MLRAAWAGGTIDEAGPPGWPAPSEKAMLLPPTARPTASPPIATVIAEALPAAPEVALGPNPRAAPPKALPKAVPPPMAIVMSEALPPGAAVAVPVASPWPMVIVVLLTFWPPAAKPVAEPPIDSERLLPDPPLTETPPVALQPLPMAIV